MHNFYFPANFSLEKARYLKKNALLCGKKIKATNILTLKEYVRKNEGTSQQDAG